MSRQALLINGEKIYADYVFNSILFDKPTLTKKQHWLLQHFKGWQIKTAERTFDSQVATLMDFRIGQQHGTSFCYVLPFSEKEALVEYTLFTPAVLQDSEYDAELKNYIENILHLSDYEITDTEFGVIPNDELSFYKTRKQCRQHWYGRWPNKGFKWLYILFYTTT